MCLKMELKSLVSCIIFKWNPSLLIIFVLSLGNYASGKELYSNLAEDTICGEVKESVKASRILGGYVAEPGEFPFLASIQNSDGVHFCSAFIVQKQILITAAHCFIDAKFGSEAYKDYKIVVGTNNWKHNGSVETMFKISRLRLHPRFSYLKPNVENDIAIIKLDRPLKWSSTVQPICVAKTNDELDHYEYGIIPGWGVRSWKETMKDWMQDSNLYKVALPIWTNVACQEEYIKHNINWNTRPSHICAGTQEKEQDTCQGDSGSPLILIDNVGTRIAYGIVSVGEGCATKLPGIYTRLSSFNKWIRDNS